MHPMFYVNYLWPHLGPATPLPLPPLPLDDVATVKYEFKDIFDSRKGHSGP